MTVLEDQIVEFSNRYALKNIVTGEIVATYDLVPVKGEIIAEGVPVTKQNILDTVRAEALNINLENFYTKEVYRSVLPVFSNNRTNLTASHVGDNVLFAAGNYSGGMFNLVEAYNVETMLRSDAQAMTYGSFYPMAGAFNANYAVFGGGSSSSNGSSQVAYVDAYNSSLVKISCTNLSYARYTSTGAGIGNYALVLGGAAGASPKNYVDAYDLSLTRTIPALLTYAYGNPQSYADNNSNFTIISNGTYVEAYNASLLHSVASNLSLSRLAGTYGCAAVGNYVLFAGGTNSNVHRDIIDAYDNSLVRTTPTTLSVARSRTCGASLGDFAVFIGGENGALLKVVDCYNTSLVRTVLEDWEESSYGLVCGVANNKGVITQKGSFVMLYDGNGGTEIKIPAFSAYKFQNHSEEQFTQVDFDYVVSGKLNGYIKPAHKTLTGLNK